MRSLYVFVIAALVLVGCGPRMSIHEAARNGDIEVVKQHLDAGADVNAKDDKFGLTPLHFAAGRGNTRKEVVELLIAKGVDVNAKDEDGETPLDWAIRNSHWKHVRRKRSETADLIHKHGGKTGEELKAERK